MEMFINHLLDVILLMKLKPVLTFILVLLSFTFVLSLSSQPVSSSVHFACLSCSGDGDCSGDNFCYNGCCVECTNDDDCASDEHCDSNMCVADCQDDTDCPNVCDESSGECVECVDDSDCDEGQYCQSNVCYDYPDCRYTTNDNQAPPSDNYCCGELANIANDVCIDRGEEASSGGCYNYEGDPRYPTRGVLYLPELENWASGVTTHGKGRSVNPITEYLHENDCPGSCTFNECARSSDYVAWDNQQALSNNLSDHCGQVITEENDTDDSGAVTIYCFSDSESACGDDIDNDNNGATDCNDDDCPCNLQTTASSGNPNTAYYDEDPRVEFDYVWNEIDDGVDWYVQLISPSGDTQPCADDGSSATSGSATDGCAITLDEVGTWIYYSQIDTVDPLVGVTGDDATQEVDVCKAAGDTCNSNSDCCSGMCEYKQDTGNYECINSCPGDFQWDGNDPGDCDPNWGGVCYSSDDVYGPCESWPPHQLDGPWWLEEAGPSGDCVDFMDQACVYRTTYDGVDYGEYLSIEPYQN